jgi:hypothetical protein
MIQLLSMWIIKNNATTNNETNLLDCVDTEPQLLGTGKVDKLELLGEFG